jgi:hypothetical protein
VKEDKMKAVGIDINLSEYDLGTKAGKLSAVEEVKRMLGGQGEEYARTISESFAKALEDIGNIDQAIASKFGSALLKHSTRLEQIREDIRGFAQTIDDAVDIHELGKFDGMLIMASGACHSVGHGLQEMGERFAAKAKDGPLDREAPTEPPPPPTGDPQDLTLQRGG